MSKDKYLTNEEVNQLIVNANRGDDVAWQKLYNNFKSYVHKCAWKKLNAFDFDSEKKAAMEEDLFQAGWEGFIAALKNYNPGRAGFITYATSYIDGAIRAELSVQLNTIGLTHNENANIKRDTEAENAKLDLEIARALQKHGDELYVDSAPAGEKYSAERRALQILSVLHTLTDENHKLSKEEINRLLMLYRVAKYKNGLPLEANNTITSTMNYLILELDPLEYKEDKESEYRILYDGYKEDRLKNNMKSSKKAKPISNFSYAHLFSDEELDTLIEQVCLSDLISEEEKKKLVKKLVSTASTYYKTPFWNEKNIKFNAKAVHSRLDERYVSKKKELVKSIGVIQEALNNFGQIRFYFNRYNAEGELEHTSAYVHTLSPYHIVVYHENYYCIGQKTTDDKQKIWHYRVDLMSDVEIIKDDEGKIIPMKVCAFEGLPIANASWNPEKYMSEHLYMAYDEPRWINIKIKNNDYTFLHDWFGNHYEKISSIPEEPGYDLVRVKTSPEMIVHWAMQYAGKVEIMDEEIREKIRGEIDNAKKKYKKVEKAMCEEENVTSYCVGKFKVKGKWEYKDKDKWADDYKKYLKWLSEQSANPYCDPDGKKAKATEYYEKLTVFLNEQEKNLIGEWSYDFIYGNKEEKNNNIYGIAVYENKEKSGNPSFFLKSDQFGFSAPEENGGHIYDAYLENMKKLDKEETAAENITTWILSTRKLGGGLLWPLENNVYPTRNPPINIARGGSNKHRTSYIEDRIDLTLWEIKHYLDYSIEEGKMKLEETEYYKKYQGDVLCQCMNTCPNLKKWMDHFKNFKTYVNFFCFQFFCKGIGSYEPWDMMHPGQVIKKDNICSIYNGCEEKDNEKIKPFCKNTETMFDILSDKIVARTEVMKKILENSEEKSRE